ncbi:hypothetical protein NQ317_015244 [Molorchus minor]|uniref:Uncharacterized protein n=1 Tax=Molorchus minor TaxID=1323400 RepID=A0ABQ9JPB9_9CUCU|nr:hypothetical protein NQ317_015244 [Molorchus minor]
MDRLICWDRFHIYANSSFAELCSSKNHLTQCAYLNLAIDGSKGGFPPNGQNKNTTKTGVEINKTATLHKLFEDSMFLRQLLFCPVRKRGELRSLWVGCLVALLSGAAVALGILSDNIASLVGVAISTSLTPPAVNADGSGQSNNDDLSVDFIRTLSMGTAATNEMVNDGVFDHDRDGTLKYVGDMLDMNLGHVFESCYYKSMIATIPEARSEHSRSFPNSPEG